MNAVLKPKDYVNIRKHFLRFVFQQDINRMVSFSKSDFSFYCQNHAVQEEYKEFFENIAKNFYLHMEEIDRHIKKHSKNWKLSRIAKVDLSILRVAVTELIFRKETDLKIILSEATELAKIFGSSSSFSFINGILDSIANDIRSQ
jgi:N utilization substance protein B